MCSAGARRPPRGEALADPFPRPGAANSVLLVCRPPTIHASRRPDLAAVLWLNSRVGGGRGRRGVDEVRTHDTGRQEEEEAGRVGRAGPGRCCVLGRTHMTISAHIRKPALRPSHSLAGDYGVSPAVTVSLQSSIHVVL